MRRKIMNITEIQAQIVREMKEQGADKQTINGIMRLLTTEEQQIKMLNYLKEIKFQETSKSQVIKKALEITGKIVFQKN